MPQNLKSIFCFLIFQMTSAAFGFDQVPHTPQLRTLAGHLPSARKHFEIGKAMEPDSVISLSIALSLNAEAELDGFLSDIYDPGSHLFHQFLSASEFAERFAPTPAQVTEVQNYLASYGIHRKSVSSNRLIVQAAGSVKNVNSAFHTELFYFARSHTVHDPHSSRDISSTLVQRHFGPIRDLRVPMDSPIQAVFGIENIIQVRPHLHKREFQQPHGEPSQIGTGPMDGLSPKNIKTAYGISNTWDGSGQTLALFEMDGYSKSDITSYAKYFSLRQPPLYTVKLDGATGKPGDAAGEVTLDIELLIALAPGATRIIVYEGPNTSQGVIDTYNKIACHNLAKVVSTSWGLTESEASPVQLQAENRIFKQMAAQGQAIYAASGDYGAFDDGVHLGVEDPASQPYVVGVGGTQLALNPDGTYLHETTWNQDGKPRNGASGGGISTIWPIPDWQRTAMNAASTGSTTLRNVPDVALNADPNTGYAIYFGGKWNVYGGTSCAAPVWAGYTTLVNQARAQSHLGMLGFPNPALYGIGQSGFYPTTFHDINDGSTNTLYPAVNGLDNATGWGSFEGDLLLQKFL